MIKFLRDYITRGSSPESFESGQDVEGRSASSELHFVQRGIAAFVDGDGNLTDHEGRPMTAVPHGDDIGQAELGLERPRDRRAPPKKVVATRKPPAKRAEPRNKAAAKPKTAKA